ncbi:hypothetical protein F4802DRAFT_556309 [Xylaria palmicola]|nr:hypothetical protein F4802DRAFT_556309 [Xylaria palmicola]
MQWGVEAHGRLAVSLSENCRGVRTRLHLFRSFIISSVVPQSDRTVKYIIQLFYSTPINLVLHNDPIAIISKRAMTLLELPYTCLNVAIDHRIKRLCKPTAQQGTAAKSSEHISIIQQHGVRLGRSIDEVKVTGELAGPATTGGIVILLSQPRYRHPFDKGLNAVIKDCKTFSALEELFTVASCGTLTLGRNLSLIDLLPFTPQRPESLPSRFLEKAFEASRLAICAKSPDVVLCAGNVQLPRSNHRATKRPARQKTNDLKRGLERLESRGIGQLDIFDSIALEGSGPELVVMSRVNGFHPSCAVNHFPEYTILRQLLLLNTVKTCGLYREDWQELKWMDSLRAECYGIMDRAKYNKKRMKKPKGRRHVRTLSGRSRILSDFAFVYFNIQKDLQESIGRMEQLQSREAEKIYDNLLGSKLSYRCNDASIILRRLSQLFRNHWSKTKSIADLQCVVDIAWRVRQLAEDVTKTPPKVQDIRLQQIIETRMSSLIACFVHDSTNPSFNLESLANIFLQMAVDIEEMLSDLLEAANLQDSVYPEEKTESSQRGNNSYQGEIIVLD